MALVVEDGTIVENANSYATLTQIRDYAISRGVTLSNVDATLESQVHAAMLYLEALRAKYKGVKVSSTQSLQWPRLGAYVDGFAVESNEIPIELVKALYELVLANEAGIDLMPTVEGAFVVKEKVGPIETEYSESVGTSSQPKLAIVKSLLEPLLSLTPMFSVVRL